MGLNWMKRADGSAGDEEYVGVINDGAIRLEGKAIVWEDLRFPASSINPAGQTAPPGVDQSSFYGTLLFDKAGVEIIAGQAQMPHSWRAGSVVVPHIHWAPTTTGGGNVRWRFSYQVASVNGAFSGTYTTETITAAAGTTADKHLVAAFSGIDMAGKGISSMILWTLERVGDDELDTYDADARLLEIDFHYQIDSLGSNLEYTKD